MPSDQIVAADVEDAGALGVLGLRRFWMRKIASRAGVDRDPVTSDDLCAENVLLAGLRLGVRVSTIQSDVDIRAERLSGFLEPGWG
jgi:hypothetical protein